MRLVYVAVALLALSCVSLEQRAEDPSRAARDARKASVAACNAYDAAVRLGVAKPDERADYACAATRGICADDLALEP